MVARCCSCGVRRRRARGSHRGVAVGTGQPDTCRTAGSQGRRADWSANHVPKGAIMNHAVTIAADLVAVTLLIAIYFRRHRRRDLVLAYLCVNIGVLAVTQVLAGSTVGAGLGLGLFGVLSIIRLRSS